jgi:phosphate transport system substrate-binding protein
MDTQRGRCAQYVTLLVVVTLLVLVPAGCAPGGSDADPAGPAASDDGIVLTVSGSGTTTAILSAVASAFEADTAGYELKVLPGAGTGGGVQGVVGGMLDVAAMARPPKEEEIAQGIAYTEFGLSGVAVYVHPSVEVTELTGTQVTTILCCEIENWSEVGGPDLPIVVYVRDEGDSSTKALRALVIGDVAFPEEGVQVLTSQSEMQDSVEATVGAVGFGSWPSAVASGSEVRAISLDGVSPSEQAYQLRTPVGIGYLSDRQADVQPLIDWLLSESGQAALRQVDVLMQ